MPGTAKIERYVPALPFSRDEERYARVLRQVTLYRMVFGQPRQDDLLAYLQETVGQGEAERLAGRFASAAHADARPSRRARVIGSHAGGQADPKVLRRTASPQTL